MCETTVKVRLNLEDEKQFASLCKSAGISVNEAINMFISKTLIDNQIPFSIGGGPITDPEVLEAMAEVERMRADPNYGKSYSSFEEMMDDVFGDDWARPSKEDLEAERRRAFASDRL